MKSSFLEAQLQFCRLGSALVRAQSANLSPCFWVSICGHVIFSFILWAVSNYASGSAESLICMTFFPETRNIDLHPVYNSCLPPVCYLFKKRQARCLSVVKSAEWEWTIGVWGTTQLWSRLHQVEDFLAPFFFLWREPWRAYHWSVLLEVYLFQQRQISRNKCKSSYP